ncbi:hypothetical protein PR048_023771 [Dryococelus australis]|uniref:Uncharacterized protein n=1 Tax=Dryococelus australis TaxID=614101 RepID=A0ABQ9GV40_9NEOP|nr:hypothetical protein PR048_023771 [Dryococelus australis]
MEQHRNARVGETENPRVNPPSRGIIWHDSRMQKLGSGPAGNETLWEVSSLTITPPRCQGKGGSLSGYAGAGRHLESSLTCVMRHGGLRHQQVSPEHSCIVAKRIGNSSMREGVCDASMSHHCQHSWDSKKEDPGGREERPVPGRGEGEVGLLLRCGAAELAPAAQQDGLYITLRGPRWCSGFHQGKLRLIPGFSHTIQDTSYSMPQIEDAVNGRVTVDQAAWYSVLVFLAGSTLVENGLGHAQQTVALRRLTLAHVVGNMRLDVLPVRREPLDEQVTLHILTSFLVLSRVLGCPPAGRHNTDCIAISGMGDTRHARNRSSKTPVERHRIELPDFVVTNMRTRAMHVSDMTSMASNMAESAHGDELDREQRGQQAIFRSTQ